MMEGEMAKIKFEVDTEDQEPKTSSDKGILPNPKKLGILSSISLPPNLLSSIDAGYGVSHREHAGDSGYNSTTIQQNATSLRNKGCEFIVAVGGLIVHTALNGGSPVKFVSLVGATPSNVGPDCLGGLSLESWASNKDRIDILMKKLSLTPAQLSSIGLYRNPSSTMHTDEKTDWDARISGPSTVIESSLSYNQDFNGIGGPSKIPAGIQGLVISADPQFQKNKNDLVAAANTWVTAAGPNRYIVYPLQIYLEASPARGKTTLYGPDLYQTYYRLGQLARSASDTGTNVGFDQAPNLTVDVV
jgi:hypothetical protein